MPLLCYNPNKRGDKMNINRWIESNTNSLKGKTVAVTGSTGGLGNPLCEILASLSANLILLDRNAEKSQNFGKELKEKFPSVNIEYITADLSDFASAKAATDRLKKLSPDIFVHNAGAYSIPRYKTDIGYDNVFQINFISPYYIIKELLPILREKMGRVVVVGSIAHNYSRIDTNDIDFSTHNAASKVYGNSKRYLMFSLFELFKNENRVSLAVTHPGITFTGITNHYPKVIFAIIKHPMKIVFMKPKKAVLSIVKGVFKETPRNTWWGPKFFGIWGNPRLSKLKTCSQNESIQIYKTAEKIYNRLKTEKAEV